jgi:hypothetical protein
MNKVFNARHACEPKEDVTSTSFDMVNKNLISYSIYLTKTLGRLERLRALHCQLSRETLIASCRLEIVTIFQTSPVRAASPARLTSNDLINLVFNTVWLKIQIVDILVIRRLQK